MEKATDKQIAFLAKNGVKISYNMNKQEAHDLIEEIIAKKNYKKEATEEVSQEEVKKSYKTFDTSSYYVAYAKDLTIALLAWMDKIEPKASMNIDIVSDKAIEVIKKFQKAFRE